MSHPVMPAPVRFDGHGGRFAFRSGTRIGYPDTGVAPVVERFCVEVDKLNVLHLHLTDDQSSRLPVGPGGTLWFSDFGANRIGEVTAGGRLRLFTVPAPYAGLNDITLGPDGAMWFTGQTGLLGRVTAAGSISELKLPPGSAPTASPPGRAGPSGSRSRERTRSCGQRWHRPAGSRAEVDGAEDQAAGLPTTGGWLLPGVACGG